MNAYDFSEFLDACGLQGAVFVAGGALQTARSDFNLLTSAEVLAFISNGGLEKPSHLNTKNWERNPKPDTPIPVDAYCFFSGFTYGYLAFFHQPTTGRWVIKSFKKNKERDPRNLAFYEAFRRSGRVNN